MKSSDKNRAIIAEVTARSWREPEFRLTFIKNPKQALQQAGAEVPADLEVEVLVNTARRINAVLPPLAEQAKYLTQMATAGKRLADLPEDVELHVVRDTATKMYIVIPAAPVALSSGKLSDQALEQVAGGKVGVQVAENTVVATQVETATLAVVAEVAVGVTSVAAAVEVVVVPCFIS